MWAVLWTDNWLQRRSLIQHRVMDSSQCAETEGTVLALIRSKQRGKWTEPDAELQGRQSKVCRSCSSTYIKLLIVTADVQWTWYAYRLRRWQMLPTRRCLRFCFEITFWQRPESPPSSPMKLDSSLLPGYKMVNSHMFSVGTAIFLFTHTGE